MDETINHFEEILKSRKGFNIIYFEDKHLFIYNFLELFFENIAPGRQGKN